MAAEQTWTRGSGTVIPDRRLVLWEAESTGLTQAGPRAGAPVAQQQGPAHLKAAGTQTAGSELRVRSQAPGFPQGGASYVWRRNGDTNWRGWDAPSALTHSEFLTWTDGSGDLKWTRNAHAATLADHTVVVAYDERDDSESKPYRVVVQVRDPTTGTWGAKVVVYEVSTATREFMPCLLALPSGRLLCYHFVYSGSEAQIRVQYSDDDGATWATGNPYALVTGLDLGAVSLHRIRAAVGGGSVSLFVWTDDGSTDAVQQYASADNGLTLTLILADFDGGASGAGACDVVWADGQFVVFWVDTNYLPYAATIGSAYTAVSEDGAALISDSSERWSNLSSGRLSDANLAAVVDESGTIYVYGLHTNSDYEGEVVRSIDKGSTWAALGQSGYAGAWGAWFSMEDSASHPADFCATTCQGRVLIVGNHNANPGSEDDSISLLYLAGWSTVTLPGYNRYPNELTRVCWERTWLPYDLPDDGPIWTQSGAGTPGLLTPGAVGFVAANTYYYTVPGGTTTEGLICSFAMKLTSGGSLTADDCSVLLRCEDGTESYDAILRISGAGLRVYDPHAAAVVGSDITAIDPNDGIVVLAAINDGNLSVWVRSLSSGSDREWTLGIDGESLTDGGAGSGHRIEWGHRSATVAISVWHWFHYTHDEWVGPTGSAVNGNGHLALGQDNPEQIMGREYSGTGTYTADGVIHTLDDGPTVRGDEWYSDVAYDYGVARLISEEYASPRLSWRSTSTAEQSIALKWDDTANTYPGDVIAVPIYGHNVPKLKVELHNGSSWSYSQTIDLSHSIAFTRLGTEVHPAGSGTDEPFLNRHEAAGWTMVMTDATTTVARRIVSNPQGKWTDAATRQTMFTLEGVDGTEGNTHTTGRLVPSSCVLLIPMRGTPYKAIRLTPIAPVAATDPRPAEAYWEIGTLAIGAFIPNPEPYSWGRYTEHESGMDLVEQRDRIRRAHATAPMRRALTYGYVDGDDLTSLLTAEADPDFVEVDGHASAVPIAVKGGALYNHEGMFRELGGPGEVVTYIAAADEIDSGDSYALLLDPEAHMLGRVVTGPYRVDVVVGNELENELVRGTEWTISEEV